MDYLFLGDYVDTQEKTEMYMTVPALKFDNLTAICQAIA
jgi:hypothetical protein